MPEGVGYGPQNTASTGLNLNIIGKHAYAYSGIVTTSAGSSADTTALLFTTGSEYIHIDSLAYVDVETSTSRTRYLTVSMNNEIVWNGRWINAQEMAKDQPLRLIIPPFTTVEIKVGGADGTSNWTIMISGKVYK